MAGRLYDHQLLALEKMHNGCILCGGVGSGKSRTAIAYYHRLEGGKFGSGEFKKMKDPRDLYIITTARKRDTKEWEIDLAPFLLSSDESINGYSNHVYIDSWNNIQKYSDVKHAFFIFDEQRVVGYGAWSKSFIKIAKHNEWILLSATPGDTWSDYIPVFIANGYYRNKSDFVEQHVIYKRYSHYPIVDRYVGTGKLVRLRKEVLVNMDFDRPTVSHHMDILVDYDSELYKRTSRDRWNYTKDEPLENASALCYELRKIVNSSDQRKEELKNIVKDKKRVIVFYNFDYELDILKGINFKCPTAEWNGHKHQPIPKTEKWVYFVQYTAGAEGWNCTETDTIVFYSQNYSYKVMVQSSGRIDRLNTPYKDLYFYHFKSKATIDLAISRALKSKKKFNEERFVNG